MTENRIARLDDLGVLRLRGPDVVRFLQGQLSNDIERLSPGTPLLAGLHNAQGRVIAVLRLIGLAPDDVLAVLPAALAQPVATRLQRYVLRARVQIEQASAHRAVYGVQGPAGREIRVTAQGQPAPDGRPMPAADWLAGDIAAGLPQVYPATSEQFLAQMLNLDLVDAVSFTKGCYTGQEIVARAHYRGRVKRRMQRFVTADAAPLKAGERLRLTDGRQLEVVEAVALAQGGHDLLAVAPLPQAGQSVDSAAEHSGLRTLEALPAPLPYALPQ